MIYIIAAVFVVAMGTGIFWQCQKSEDSNDKKEVSTKSIRKNLGYYDTAYLQYIQELSSNTGVDLLNLYQETYISVFFDALQQHTNGINNGYITTLYLQDFNNVVQNAASNNDTITLVEQYSVLGQDLYDIGSLDEETYAGQVYLFPTSNRKNMVINMNTLKSSIASDYPNFTTLSDELQNQIIAEAIWLLQSEGGHMCYGPLEDERDRKLVAAEVIWYSAMILCVPVGVASGGFFGVLCMGAASLVFKEATDTINEWYDNEKKKQKK